MFNTSDTTLTSTISAIEDLCVLISSVAACSISGDNDSIGFPDGLLRTTFLGFGILGVLVLIFALHMRGMLLDELVLFSSSAQSPKEAGECTV